MAKVTIRKTKEGILLNYAQATRIGDILKHHWKDCPEVVVTVENKRGTNSHKALHMSNAVYDDGIITIEGLNQEQLEELALGENLNKAIDRAIQFTPTFYATGGIGL